MAGGKCSITCNVKDSKGQVKVSALWKDLISFFKGDRRDAMIHYFLAKDSKFLRENSNILEFDVDGEVTIASLKKALESGGEYTNLSNAKTLSYLNTELKAGEYDYSEALDNVLKFNRSNQFRDGFMATLKKESNGKYSIKVVERNPSTEYELADHVQNKILTDAIRLILKDRGLSVEFLDNSSYAVQYSTQNAHLDADGLMAVASVLDGQSSAIETAEAAGHFIVAAMQDSPLVQRLINMLTPEVQNAIFKNESSDLLRDDFIVSDDSAREAAGILLGRELIHPFKQAQKTKAAIIGSAIPKGIKWLLSKIAELGKRIVGIKPDEVKKLVEQAKHAASTAAEGFISDSSNIDVNEALNSPETYTAGNMTKRLSDDVRKNVNAYYETLGGLKDIVSRLRTSIGRAENPTNRDVLNNLKTLVKGVSSNYNSQMSLEAFARNASIEGMVVIFEGITQILDTNIRTLLEQIQPSDRAQSYANIVSNARNMTTVNTAIKNIGELCLAIQSKLDSLEASDQVQFPDASGNQVVTTLRESVKRLQDVLVGNDEIYIDLAGEEQHVHGLQGVMELKRRQIFIDALSNFYGKDFIEKNAGIIWQQKGFRPKLVKSGFKTVEIRDLVDSLDEDISLFDRYFSSASDCGDFVTAIGAKVTKNSNMQADRLASLFWDRIEELRLQMADAFGNTDCSILFEYIEDSDGHRTKTGNLVSQTNLGEWENARHEFKEQLKRDFNNYLAELRKKAYENNKGVKGYVFRLTDLQRGVLYHNFSAPLWEKWHQENSEIDKSVKGKRYIPNHVKYHNRQWDELFDTNNPGLSREEKDKRVKMLKWYNTLMELKGDMDALLPQNATVRQRAPQMTGRLYHRFRNLQGMRNNNIAAFGQALRRRGQDMYAVRQDEAYLFGSNNEFNEIEDDPLENSTFFEREKINRLPLYGINKLKHMEDLSTDLFGTLLSYGSMAATYKAMERVVDIFELGRDTLKQRKVNGKSEKMGSESRAYSRYIKFLEKQIYGIGVKPPKIDRKGMLTKIASGLSSLGSRILLWGNVHGGIVNTGTGILEMYKEAVAGENYNTSELWEAHHMYFNGLLSGDDGGIWQTVGNGLLDRQRPMDKNALWIRHWNILSDNRSFLHGQRYDTSASNLLNNRLWEWFGHSMMLPYSSGEHYMQTIPYYAMGIHEKVYDRNGNRINLIDAYEIVDGEEVYAIDDIDNKGEILGRTPKKLKLKDGIFRSVEDIDKYDTVQSMLDRIQRYYDNNPNVKNTTPIALDMFADKEKDYLDEEGFSVPTNVKQLENLKAALQLKIGELTYNTSDESAFMDKCRNITNRLHGIYNSEDKVAFQQNFYGNLVMAMRGYALGMINRRYAGSKFNVPQNKVVEGSYNTFLKVLVNAVWNINSIDNWKATGEAMLLALPLTNLTLFSKKYGNKLKADMVKAGFSEHQYYNMRRTGADFLVLEALALLNFLSSPGRHFGLNDEDDEEGNNKNDTSDNFMAGLLYYFTMRWFNEQGAFTWPTAMLNEGNSLLDYIPVGLSGTGAIADILQLAIRTGFDKDLENSKLYYQSTKEGKYEVGDAKAKIRFFKLCPYYRSWYTLQNPYDAASSYEYGRRIR